MALKTLVCVGAATIGVLGYRYWQDRHLRRVVNDASAQIQEVFSVDEDEVDYLETSLPVIPKLVAKRHNALFRNFLLREAQAKFGVIRDVEANRLVVRKYLYDICVARNVRTRHIVENLDFSVSTFFIPTHDRLVALAVPKTTAYKAAVGVLAALGSHQGG